MCRFPLPHVSIASTEWSLAKAGVSLLIPACNEEGGVAAVVEQARQVLADIPGLPGDCYEIIVIDDGSRDQRVTVFTL